MVVRRRCLLMLLALAAFTTSAQERFITVASTMIYLANHS